MGPGPRVWCERHQMCASVLRSLSQPTFGEKLCPICNCQITEPSFSTHLFEHHPSQVCHKSLTDAIILISSLDIKFILSLGSKLNYSLNHFPVTYFYHSIIFITNIITNSIVSLSVFLSVLYTIPLAGSVVI